MSAAKIPVNRAKEVKGSKPPKPGKDTIYVDVDDEITSIIDKIQNAKEKIVALVLPKRSAALQSIVNMRLLKRSADEAEKNVVLITSEAALLPLAGAAGLHVAKNLQSKPEIPPSPRDEKELPPALDTEELPDEEPAAKDAKLDYHRSIGELASAQAGDEESETIPLDEEEDAAAATGAAIKAKAPKNKKLKVPNFDRFRLLLGAGILAFVCLIIFIILALFVLPKATVAIQTTSVPVTGDLSLNASDTAKALDEDKKIIPAQLKKSDQTASQNVQASGQQNNGDKATGPITFSIPCSAVSGNPPHIPAGTGVSTSGLSYITQTATDLNNASFTGGCHFTGSTNITAQAGGAKYNIGTSTFTISGSSYPNVTGSGSASGGTDNNVTILSQSDVDKVKQKISSADSDNFSKQFQKQLTDSGLYVLASTLKLSDPVVSSDVPVGSQASSANVTVKITYSALTVQKSDLQKAITDALNKQIDQSKQKLSSSDIVKDSQITVTNQPSPTTATLQISINTTAIPGIDINNVKKQVEGQKVGDIKASLSNIPGVKSVDVKLSPFWVSHAPKKPGKIHVTLQQVSDSSSGGQ